MEKDRVNTRKKIKTQQVKEKCSALRTLEEGEIHQQKLVGQKGY